MLVAIIRWSWRRGPAIIAFGAEPALTLFADAVSSSRILKRRISFILEW